MKVIDYIMFAIICIMALYAIQEIFEFMALISTSIFKAIFKEEKTLNDEEFDALTDLILNDPNVNRDRQGSIITPKYRVEINERDKLLYINGVSKHSKRQVKRFLARIATLEKAVNPDYNVLMTKELIDAIAERQLLQKDNDGVE